MNSRTCLLCLLAAAKIIQVGATPITLTFDGLNPVSPVTGDPYSPVPGGYGGLQWNNFDVINVTTVQQQSSGYHTGLISPGNVLFDPYGDSAAISAATTFNLYSAYLTSAFVNTSTIEIQGYRGSVEIYDHTYTITSNAPTLINFDFMDVNQVKFITPPDHLFVLDDLTIAIPDGANTLALLSASAAICALGLRRLKNKVPARDLREG